MKTAMKLVLLLSLLFCLEGNAQAKRHSENEQVISNKSTYEGRRELRGEFRRHRAASALASKNEHASRKKHHLGTHSNHKGATKQMAKERRKARRMQEKEDKGKSEPIEEKPKN